MVGFLRVSTDMMNKHIMHTMGAHLFEVAGYHHDISHPGCNPDGKCTARTATVTLSAVASAQLKL